MGEKSAELNHNHVNFRIVVIFVRDLAKGMKEIEGLKNLAKIGIFDSKKVLIIKFARIF